MASAVSGTLLTLFVAFCTLGCGWTAEKLLRPENGKNISLDKGMRDTWERTIHLDGRPVDRFAISSSKPTRSHRFLKMEKDSSSHLQEDVDPEWVNLDGFAVLGGAAVSNSSRGTARSRQTVFRHQPSRTRATRVNRTAFPLGVSNTRTHRRPPQSSSGHRQPERTLVGARLLGRRQQHHTKPQSDQRNPNTQKLTSESVHVVSLQAKKVQGQSTLADTAVSTKTTTPEPKEHVAQDISVRVMSPHSVLVSWVDPVVEMGKVDPGVPRSYTVRYREKGESARWEYKESNQRRVMIDTLTADSMYEFAVRISQGTNDGKWSISVFQRTPESAPSGPPENFEVKPLRGKGTAIKATWDPPEEPNGRIKEYILSYAPAMKPFGMKTVTYRGSTTTATIEGLAPGDRYIFKIRATNRRGQGPQSKVVSVAIPGSSSTASSVTKTKDSHKTRYTPSKLDTNHDDSDLQSTELQEEPTAQPQPHSAAPANRRVRPLSQTRSYHNIFSSLRGSFRNSLNRGSSRGRAQDREDEEEEVITTSPPKTEATTAMEVVPETKEPENNVSPESEVEVGYKEETLTTESPSLKVLTPSSTKMSIRANERSRSSIKVKVHQKPATKSSSTSDATPSTSSSSSDDKESALVSVSSKSQDSVASRNDNAASSYPESKDTHTKPSATFTKPSTSVVKDPISPQAEATSVHKGSTSAGRMNGSGLGPRYGYNRRYPGSGFRGNSSRVLNGYKPAMTSQSNLPRTSIQVTSNNRDSKGSQSTLPEWTQTHKTTNTTSSSTTRPPSQSVTQIQEKTDSYSFDKSPSTLEPKSKGPTTSQTSESSSNMSSIINISGSSQSTSHNTQNPQHSHKSSKQDITFNNGNGDSFHKNTDVELTKTEEPTSSSKAHPTEQGGRQQEERKESNNEKTVFTRNRINPSFAERFPWLASRYPSRFGSGRGVSSSRQDSKTPSTRNSSSMGAGTPILRGTSTRISGATGAVGVSRIQEHKEDLRNYSTHDSLKNGVGLGLVKPSLIHQTAAFSGSRNSDTSSSSFSSTTTTVKPVSNHPSSGQGVPHKPSNREASNENNIDNKNNLNEKSREMTGKIDKVADPISTLNKPTIASADSRRNLGDNPSVDTSSRTRSGTTSGVTSSHVRPGVGTNRRGHYPLLANRKFGGSRLPIRTQPGDNSKLGSSTSHSSSSSSDSPSSSGVPRPVLTSDRGTGSGNTVIKTEEINRGNSQSTSSTSFRDSFRGQGGRTRYPSMRIKPANGGQLKPGNGNGKNGRPNLTATNEKESPSSHGTNKAAGQKFITGPDGTKWVIDLELGVLMNQDGQVLQDSEGKPKRVVLGEDGRTIFDLMGSPLVNQEGMALFGHGRDSQPVVNPKERVLMVGGKPILGLDLPHLWSTTTTTTTTITMAPTTTPEPTTTEWTTEESTTAMAFPTCPPGTFSKTDEYGKTGLDSDGILDCYPEEESSGMEMDHMVTLTMVPDALVLEKEIFVQTTLQPTTTTATTTTAPTTTTTTTAMTTERPTPEIDSGPYNSGPSSEFDLSGKKRFTARYVNYIQKDPGAPCSLTEALEYLQVDVLENLIEKDIVAANQTQPPKNKPHNLTVVAMEGCHSFIILDWALPLKGDMVSGYMVHSASYDDVLNNRWSSRVSSGTHLAVENLKPNSRYYFKVQAKNVFGLGPISETLTYVTESDDPLLIERPPGGEPIWIPFKFKYNSAHSTCRGSQYVKRTWYRKFVGVVLCNSLRYKIFMGDGLREPFYSIGDTFGQGEDHCQFVDSYRDGRTGPEYLSNHLPTAQGYYRAFRQEPVAFGIIGRRTSHPFVGWYECGVPIPGKW